MSETTSSAACRCIDNTIYLKQRSGVDLPAMKLPKNHDFLPHLEQTTIRSIVSEPYPRPPLLVTTNHLFEWMRDNRRDKRFSDMPEDAMYAFGMFSNSATLSQKFKNGLWEKLPTKVRDDFLKNRKEFTEAEANWKKKYGVPIIRLPHANVDPSQHPYSSSQELNAFRSEIMEMLYKIESGSEYAVLVYRPLTEEDLRDDNGIFSQTSASVQAGPALPDPARDRGEFDTESDEDSTATAAASHAGPNVDPCTEHIVVLDLTKEEAPTQELAKSGEKRCADKHAGVQEGPKFPKIVSDDGKIIMRSNAKSVFPNFSTIEAAEADKHEEVQEGPKFHKIVGDGGAIMMRSNAKSVFPNVSTIEAAEENSGISETSSWSLLTQADKLAMVQLGELPESQDHSAGAAMHDPHTVLDSQGAESQDDGMAEIDRLIEEAGREESERDALERDIKKSRQDTEDSALDECFGSSMTAIMEREIFHDCLRKDFEEAHKTYQSAYDGGK